jgi:hypothetical protein
MNHTLNIKHELRWCQVVTIPKSVIDMVEVRVEKALATCDIADGAIFIATEFRVCQQLRLSLATF